MPKHPAWEDNRHLPQQSTPYRVKTPTEVKEAQQASISALSEKARRERAVALLKRRAFAKSLPRHDGTKEQPPTPHPHKPSVWDELPTEGMKHGDRAVLEDGTQWRYDGTYWQQLEVEGKKVVLFKVSRRDDTRFTYIKPRQPGNLLAVVKSSYQQSPAPTPRSEEMPRFYKWPSRVPVY